MAIDKAVDSDVLDAGLLSVADAIRAKTGTADKLAFPEGMAAAVGKIPDYLSMALSNELTEYTNKESAYLRAYSFYGCTKLTKLDLWKVTNIAGGAFAACLNLTTLILRSDTLCLLQAPSTFNDTPYASGGTGGTVYVPAALVESYKTATNWSTFYEYGTCNFIAIEGSEYE